MMTLSRRAILVAAMTIPVAGTILRPALAASSEIFAPGGVAIGGYDPVAYFTEGRAVQGAAEHAVRWRGAIWYFSSARNMTEFEMNPKHYAPQFGGWCAPSVSEGLLRSPDPELFAIASGRLYLAESQASLTLWLSDVAGNRALAEANWPGLSGH